MAVVISEPLKKALSMKTALFDTCALSTIKASVKKVDVQHFLQFLDSIKCVSSVNDLIKAEFLRDANTYQGLVERKNFLETLCQDVSLPFHKPIYNDAMILSYIYVRHKCKGVGLIDLMTSALLKQYAEHQSLILVTENHKDYPLVVHDRVGTLVLDLGKTLATIGFYTINLEKWAEAQTQLFESEQWNSD